MHNAQEAETTLLFLAKPRSRNPELRAFGSYLAALRGARTREQIAIRLADLGAPLGGSTIAQYEKGTVWAPDPAVLSGLATIYGERLEDFVQLLKINRKYPDAETLSDLLRHGGTGQRDSRQGEGADVPAEARKRIADLERRLQKSEALLDQVSTLASSLARVIAAREEGSTTTRTEPGPRGTHRKVG